MTNDEEMSNFMQAIQSTGSVTILTKKYLQQQLKNIPDKLFV